MDFPNVYQRAQNAIATIGTTSNQTYLYQLNQYQRAANEAASQIAQMIYPERTPMPDGTKPVVICRDLFEQVETLEAAQTKAEELAHQHNANAYILKPIRKVAPKRDTVSTDL